MKTRFLLLLGVAAASIGCRAHPCGDRSAELPSALEGLPVLEDGGKVCYARENEGEATIMYWGGKDVRSQVTVKLLAKMSGAGWSQYQPSGPYAPPPNPDLYLFRKDDQRVSVRMSLGDTPRFGAKLPAESITVNVRHEVVEAKAPRSQRR